MCIISIRKKATKYSEDEKLNYLRLYHDLSASSMAFMALPC